VARDLVPLALSGTRLAPVLQRKQVQVFRVPEIDATLMLYKLVDPVIGGYEPEPVALRRALNLGFNTDEVIASIYKYQAFPAQALIFPGTYGFDPAPQRRAPDRFDAP